MSLEFTFDMMDKGFVEDYSMSYQNGYKQHKKPIVCWVRPGEICYEVGLTKDRSALISKEDLELVCNYNWHADKTSHEYRAKTKVKVDGKYKSLYIHRLIMGASELVCDHIRDEFRESFELDNRRTNLRLVTASQNQHNRLLNDDACVAWNDERQRYQVMVCVDGIIPYRPTFTVRTFGTKDRAFEVAKLCEGVFRNILHNNRDVDDDWLYTKMSPTVKNIIKVKAATLMKKWRKP